MNVSDVCTTLTKIAPPELAQDWDNVGLLIGQASSPCSTLLLTIDLTEAVLDEAIGMKAPMIMAYHPPLFKPISRVLAESKETDALIWKAIRHDIAIYSMHTALDAAQGGTCDTIVDLCGGIDARPFEYHSGQGAGNKVVTFVPLNAVDAVAAAMSHAGAGIIGHYADCSFRITGTGTFKGGADTNPAVGQAGRHELVEEVRLEMVACSDTLPQVIQAIKQSHPYEEPAFDIYPLLGKPADGIGRIATLGSPVTLRQLSERLKEGTPCTSPTLVGDESAVIHRIAVLVGAAGQMPLRLGLSETDCIVTGEIRHHDALATIRQPTQAIALGHWASERPVLDTLRQRLASELDDLEVAVSQADCDPFQPL